VSLHPSSHAQHQDLPLALPCHIVKPCARQKGKAENEGETRKTTRKGNTSDVRPQKKKRKKRTSNAPHKDPASESFARGFESARAWRKTRKANKAAPDQQTKSNQASHAPANQKGKRIHQHTHTHHTCTGTRKRKSRRK
jgi:hypothetical protein